MIATVVIGSLAVWIGLYIRGQMKNADRKLSAFLQNREVDGESSDMAVSRQLLALNRSTSVGAGRRLTFSEPVSSAGDGKVSETHDARQG
jgi:hypothetical protein